MSPMHRMRTANSRPHHPRKFPFDFEETLRFRDMCCASTAANANGARALRAFVVARRSASPFGERRRRRATRVTRVSKADVWPGRRCAPSASVASVWSEPSRQSDVRDSVRPSVSQPVGQTVPVPFWGDCRRSRVRPVSVYRISVALLADSYRVGQTTITAP